MKHLAALLTLTFLVFANSLGGAFVFDDMTVVFQNVRMVHVQSASDTLHVLSGPRQILFFTYALNRLYSGADPFGYHLTNVLLHAICVLLVYGIILHLKLTVGCFTSSAMNEDRRIAFWGAAVFSVHTMLTGAVSYVAGRSSVLCGLFYFAAVLCFLKGYRAKYWYLLAGLMAILAWETKQEAITLPLALAGLAWLRHKNRDWRIVAALPTVLLAIMFLMFEPIHRLYSTVTGNVALVSLGFDSVLPAAVFFRTYVAAVVWYVLPRFVFPAALSIDPMIPTAAHWYSPVFVVAVVFLAAVVVAFFKYGIRDRLLGSGLVLLFVSPLAAYAALPMADVIQEHRSYIPALGVALLFAWAFQRMSRWVPVVVVIVFGLMTIQRNTVWRTEKALWTDAVAKSPNNARSHLNLGAAYANVQQYREAIQEYARVIELNPSIYPAYSNMAGLLALTGNLDQAEKILLRVTHLSPNYADAFVNLGLVYDRERRPIQAITALNRAIEINPDNYVAHANKGDVFSKLRMFPEAVTEYMKAAYLRPDSPNVPTLREKIKWAMEQQ